MGRPNGSAISQVRTSEIEAGFPWELRQFRLGGTPVRLREVTVAQSPRNNLNGTARVRDFVNTRETSILAGTHVVPLSFRNATFRAGASENNIDFWSATGIRNNDARHIFSLNTCNGCHGAETGTFILHVVARRPGFGQRRHAKVQRSVAQVSGSRGARLPRTWSSGHGVARQRRRGICRPSPLITALDRVPLSPTLSRRR
jgi:hypothetical protein